MGNLVNLREYKEKKQKPKRNVASLNLESIMKLNRERELKRINELLKKSQKLADKLCKK